MTDVELTRALERCEVPNEGFRHRDHLRVACVYLQESPTVSDALARMTATLRRFAASVGKAEKYSDAITAFWMYQVASARAMMPDADCEAIVRAYPRVLTSMPFSRTTPAMPLRLVPPIHRATHRIGLYLADLREENLQIG